VQRGRESYAETSDAGRLPALMTRIERAPPAPRRDA